MIRRYLVTGASGFVGTYLVADLAQRGYDVVATSRRRPGYLDREAFARVRFAPADIRIPGALDAALEGVERVYHVAALFDFFARERDLLRTNVEGTRNLLTASARAGVKEFVLFGSGAIYGKEYENRLAREEDPPRPTDAYARSKWEQERAAVEANRGGLAVLTLRPGAIYGPGSVYGDARALYLLKKGLLFGKPGMAAVVSSHVHVRDVVRAATWLADRRESWLPGSNDPSAFVYNLADRSPALTHELLAAAAREVRDKGLLGFWNLRIPAWSLKLSAHVVEACARLLRIRPLFEVDSIDYITCGHGLANGRLLASGFEFDYPDLMDGLRATIRWYEETGWSVFREPEQVLWGLVG
ncbi:MAG: NAD-dependent epimerase/dehydratase family protein [Planctomycetes bacterium]|nr:NAD-dependent epimerase/dehydratase family protein [Planctomycetota bacterium]